MKNAMPSLASFHIDGITYRKPTSQLPLIWHVWCKYQCMIQNHDISWMLKQFQSISSCSLVCLLLFLPTHFPFHSVPNPMPRPGQNTKIQPQARRLTQHMPANDYVVWKKKHHDHRTAILYTCILYWKLYVLCSCCNVRIIYSNI